jgi:hypothetical protein
MQERSRSVSLATKCGLQSKDDFSTVSSRKQMCSETAFAIAQH